MRQNKALALLLLLLLCPLLLIGCTPNDNTSLSTLPNEAVVDDNEIASNDLTDATTDTADTTNNNQSALNPTTDSIDSSDSDDGSNSPADTATATTNSANESAATAELHCTISINCSSIAEHLDDLNEAKTDFVPSDGWLLEPTEVVFYEGESAFNVLLRTCKQNKLHMEYRDTPIYNSAYICGIGNLYEFDCGDLSGWMYAVNGTFPNYGCSQYTMADGDTLEFIYTCDLGASEQANINIQ